MAFDEQLANRVREEVAGQSGIVEKRMFGGIAFLLNGNMAVGVHRDELIVRIAPETTDAALRERGVRIFDISGRPMKGWLLVSSSAVEKPAALAQWISRGIQYASSLPKK